MKKEYETLYNLYSATKDECNCSKNPNYERKIGLIQKELEKFNVNHTKFNALIIAKQFLQKNGY